VLFHQRRAGLLARGSPAAYGGTVAATWALAFIQLEESDPGAVALLRLLAFCAAEAIPLSLLLVPRPGLAEQLSPEVAEVLAALLEDELAAGDALAALRRYSLVRPTGDGAVSVHRLVQAVTADQMPEDLRRAWRQAVAALVQAAIPADTQLPAAWPVCALLLPHARAVLDLTSGGMWRIALYLAYSGNYAAARDLFQLIAAAYEEDDSYGPEHEKTLAARSNLTYQTGEAGDAARARDQYAELLPTLERVQGPEHPDTLAARSNLADWTGETGGKVQARDQLADLLPIQERVLGPEHPDTLTARDDLTTWTRKAGDDIDTGVNYRW